LQLKQGETQEQENTGILSYNQSVQTEILHFVFSFSCKELRKHSV